MKTEKVQKLKTAGKLKSFMLPVTVDIGTELW